MVADSDRPAAFQLIEDATLLRVTIVRDEKGRRGEFDHVRLTIREDLEDEDDEGILDVCAFGLIYVLGMLSFHDARPRGNSALHYLEDDEWTVADMLSHVQYDRGVLSFFADYVRGRMMKTTVEVHPDGTIILDTVGRGSVATTWIAKLMGRKPLRLAMDAAHEDPPDRPN